MGKPAEVERCPDCGNQLVLEPGLPGLCPQCLLSLALRESPSPANPENEAATLARPAPGRILGERYQVREVLGRGGMGEVFRAFDLKLRVEVALKAVRVERASERTREMLRGEVRTAREVVSPNVCRIFDLVVEDGQELVSMEYIDGVTLGETLRTRGPLVLGEAREIASQFLSGLEAIHQAGLVHRDFKPENVMLTRAGRVVVMDFGLAKARSEEGTGTVSGTPAYMSPEQGRGESLDARADVYAAGVVLAEMLSVGGSGAFEARQALWRGVREVPPRVPEGPWAEVLRKALSPIPEERPASARALARSLEEVTQRLPGFETRRPYPGLSSFTEEDAEYFFGREMEVEAVWRKLKHPRMLALIAPSGAGKSSFLRAGLLPTLPKGWKALITTPGNRPFQALARALAPAFAGDAQAVQDLLQFEEADTAVALFHRFRQRHEHALVILDQFEELFTLSPPAVQEAYAKLLSRLVLEADLHVVLSLRDDFLVRCHQHEPLAPATSDLTILPALSESGLRRALVQPALSCGYRFEDEALVEEMVGEVQKERGALPLLAFAASRLWEMRDREKGLLTREAYGQIGGVGGALAQHAEATLERIGTPRTPLVREIFRNLVTAQGTRAVRERDELLSVFAREGDTMTRAPEGDLTTRARETDPTTRARETDPTTRAQEGGPASRSQAEDVLNALVDARLLTSYERPGEGGESHHQIEIIHESLLANWPRLVRWQTQDADGSQLRDQLRQAAQLWQDRGQTEDLLWSGQAYRDFAVWRERYPVPLTAAEDAFAVAMTARATRQRRRRRALGVGAIALAATVAIVTSVLWHRADVSRRKAEAETQRAEASKVLVLAERELETYPTGALAFAMKSLELADTEAGRLLAVKVLQRAPLARIARMRGTDAEGGGALGLDFSPSGEWVATGGYVKSELLHRDGAWRLALGGFRSAGQGGMGVVFDRTGERLIANQKGNVRVWSIPEGKELRRAELDLGTGVFLWRDGFLTLTSEGKQEILRSWPFDRGDPRVVGSMEASEIEDVSGSILAYARGFTAYLRSLDDWASPPAAFAKHTAAIRDVALDRAGSRLAVSDASEEVRLWTLTGRKATPERVLQARGTFRLGFDPAGRWLFAGSLLDGRPTIRLWDLHAPSAVGHTLLVRGDTTYMNALAFDGSGHWLATAHATDVALWWLGDDRPRVLTGHERPVTGLTFAPDSRALFSASPDDTVRRWPLTAGGEEPRVIFRGSVGLGPNLEIDPSGRFLVYAGRAGEIHLVPLDGSPARKLAGFSEKAEISAVTFGDGGRLVAAAPYIGPREDKVVRIWNVETGEARVLAPIPGAGEGFVGSVEGTGALRFVGRDRILAASRETGLVSFDLRNGTARVEAPRPNFDLLVSSSRRSAVGWHNPGGSTSAQTRDQMEMFRLDLEGGPAVPLRTHPALCYAAIDPTDTLLATGSWSDGTVRVGPISGEEPHVFFGHQGQVHAIAFSPDGRWVASAGADGTIRLWPVPDVRKTPLHKRPFDELLAVLRSHTNLRAVPDAKSATGYKLEPGPFPGWARPPEW